MSELRTNLARISLASAFWIVFFRFVLHRSTGDDLVFGAYSIYLAIVVAISFCLAAATTGFIFHKNFLVFVAFCRLHRVPIVILAGLGATLMIFLILFTPPFVRDAAIGVLFAGALFLISLMSPAYPVARPRQLRRAILVNAGLVVLSLVTSLIILEVGLRFCLPYKSCRILLNTDDSHILRDLPMKYASHPYLIYYPAPGFISTDEANRHNSLGYRDGREFPIPKPQGVFRIVALGGSTTYSEGVRDWRQSYSYELQNVLRAKFGLKHVEVINAGAGGYTTWESLVNLQFRVIDLNPDLILIYHAINDVHSRLVPQNIYRGDNTARRKSWDEGYFKTPIFFVPSKLLRLVGLMFRWMQPPALETLVGGPINRNYNPPWISAANLDPFAVLRMNPPTYFKRNLKHMALVANQHRIELAIISFAVKKNPGKETSESQLPPLHYTLAINEHNAIAEGIAEEFGGMFIDLSSHMPSNDHLWRPDGVHFTHSGNRERARFIAGALVRSGIFLSPNLRENSEVSN